MNLSDVLEMARPPRVQYHAPARAVVKVTKTYREMVAAQREYISDEEVRDTAEHEPLTSLKTVTRGEIVRRLMGAGDDDTFFVTFYVVADGNAYLIDTDAMLVRVGGDDLTVGVHDDIYTLPMKEFAEALDQIMADGVVATMVEDY